MTTSGRNATMRWAAAESRHEEPAAAATEVGESLAGSLGEGPVDLVLAFLTAELTGGAEEIAAALRQRLAPGCLAAVSGASVIGAARELESGPALTAVAARLPGVEVRPFLLVAASWGDAADDPLEFARHTPGAEGAELVLLFADPFSLDTDRVLRAFHRHARGVRVVGGVASAGPRPGGNVLVLNDWLSHEGGIGIALQGALRADVVVSQGCRPIGPPLRVTKVDANLVLELDGQPALERAEQVLRDLPEREREVLKNGLYVGRPAKGGASGRGDWLIRNLMGANRDRGALAVADLMAENETVRLHVRDAASATEDLELLLAPQEFDSKAMGALLFSCTGRGRRFFGKPDRDIATLQAALGGSVPAAGFFCAGEIGPVGERNFVHGHTASIAIVRAR
jgi:small ligand-binding sensory domain FIST